VHCGDVTLQAPDSSFELAELEADRAVAKQMQRRAKEDAKIGKCPGLDIDDPFYKRFLVDNDITTGTKSADLKPEELEALQTANDERQFELNKTALIAEGVILLIALILAIYVYLKIIAAREAAAEKAKADLLAAKAEQARLAVVRKRENEIKREREQKEKNLAAEVTRLQVDGREEQKLIKEKTNAASAKLQKQFQRFERDQAALNRQGDAAENELQTAKKNIVPWVKTEKAHANYLADIEELNVELSKIGASEEVRRKQLADEEEAKKLKEGQRTKQKAEHDTANTLLINDEDSLRKLKTQLNEAQTERTNAVQDEKDTNDAKKSLPTVKKDLAALETKTQQDVGQFETQQKQLNTQLTQQKALKVEQEGLDTKAGIKGGIKAGKQIVDLESKISAVGGKILGAKHKLQDKQAVHDNYADLMKNLTPQQAKAATSTAKRSAEDLDAKYTQADKAFKEKIKAEKVMKRELEALDKAIAGDAATIARIKKSLSTVAESGGCCSTSESAKEKKESDIIKSKINYLRYDASKLRYDHRACEQEITAFNTIIAQSQSTTQSTIQQLETSKEQYAVVQKSFGVDRRRLDLLLNKYQEKKRELEIIQDAVKQTEFAVTANEKEKKKNQTLIRTRDLKREFQEIDVMTTKLAEEIAGACAITCNHEKKEDGNRRNLQRTRAGSVSSSTTVTAPSNPPPTEAPIPLPTPMPSSDDGVYSGSGSGSDSGSRSGYDSNSDDDDASGDVPPTAVVATSKPVEAADTTGGTVVTTVAVAGLVGGHVGCDWKCDSTLRRIDLDVDGKVHQRQGDFVVWRPDRKGNELQISVYDEESSSFKVIKLTINSDDGCLVQEGSTHIVDEGSTRARPTGFVGESLAGALGLDNFGFVENIKYFDPKNPKKTPLQLHRQIFVAEADLGKISRDVYADKRIYILLFAFELFDWMSDWGFYAINTTQDITLKCSMDTQGSGATAFKYDEYVKGRFY
jgi:hypothetical protein